VRVAVTATGAIDRVEVAPGQLSECVEPIVRDAEFRRGEDRELSIELTL
jgi:hypothetical protein